MASRPRDEEPQSLFLFVNSSEICLEQKVVVGEILNGNKYHTHYHRLKARLVCVMVELAALSSG